MSAASEFTKKAIELARESEYMNKDVSFSNEPVKTEFKRSITIRLTQTEIDLIIMGLDALEIKSKQIIKRAKNFPSETIKSSVTIEKHESIIEDIRNASSAFCEGID